MFAPFFHQTIFDITNRSISLDENEIEQKCAIDGAQRARFVN